MYFLASGVNLFYSPTEEKRKKKKTFVNHKELGKSRDETNRFKSTPLKQRCNSSPENTKD